MTESNACRLGRLSLHFLTYTGAKREHSLASPTEPTRLAKQEEEVELLVKKKQEGELVVKEKEEGELAVKENKEGKRLSKQKEKAESWMEVGLNCLKLAVY